MSDNDEYRSRIRPVRENMRWQRTENVIQRVGEIILIAVVILGACGLFSKGFLSEGTAQSRDRTVSVEYERFGRVQSNMNMAIRLSPQNAAEFTLRIGSGALDRLEVQTLQPQPVRSFTAGNTLLLTYSSRDVKAGHSVWLGLQPQSPGRVQVSVGLEGAEPARFTQWIYP